MSSSLVARLIIAAVLASGGAATVAAAWFAILTTKWAAAGPVAPTRPRSAADAAARRAAARLRLAWLRRPGQPWSPQILEASISRSVEKATLVLSGRAIAPGRWAGRLTPDQSDAVEPYGRDLMETHLQAALADWLGAQAVVTDGPVRLRLHAVDFAFDDALVPEHVHDRQVRDSHVADDGLDAAAAPAGWPGAGPPADPDATLRLELHVSHPARDDDVDARLRAAGLNHMSQHARDRAADAGIDVADVIAAVLRPDETRSSYDNRTVFVKGDVSVVVANATRDVVTVWSSAGRRRIA